jgi:alkylation response protein AidB-like acyl-CoA dehydrogenase
MEFVFSPEQEELRASLRKFLETRSPETEVRRVMETEPGYDPTVWNVLTAELGLTALAIPEEYGGLGYGFLEVSIALEEMGRALLCAPYLSSCLAATALVRSGDEWAQADLLPGIAAGTTLATLAYMETPHDWAGRNPSTRARRVRDSYELDGRKRYVLDGAIAEVALVLAATDDGPGLFAVETAAEGVSRSASPTMDLTRRLAEMTFDRAPARLIGGAGEAMATLSATLDVAAAALAAEQVGGAQRVLEMSVEYAKMRVQFGRPIGSFQAIKHKCADMFLAVESARAASHHAAWTAVDDPAAFPVAASLAKAHCSTAFATAAAENIQIHGGIGFTWEHPAHLYFKRAKSGELLFGDPAYHRDLIAQRLGVATATAVDHG